MELAKAGVTGEVIVEFIVTASGNVAEPHVVNQCHPEFARAAIEAVLASKYKPGILDGRPVNSRVRVPIVFDLKEVKE